MSTPAASDRQVSSMEVLVATVRQEDFSLVEKMHLEQNAVIANQCDRWDYAQMELGNGKVRMLSTRTRGVGVNRNLALQLSSADVLLFADDDLVYYDGTLQAVENAFRELPDADVIFFGMDMTRNGVVYEKRRDKVKRRYLWNSLKYGTYRIAVRRASIVKHRISFSTLFGGGCIYGSGEDTIFIRECLRAGLKLYSHSYVLGTCAKDSSSWFTGYNEKYFFDRGAMLACAFPRVKHLLKWYFTIKLSRKTGKPIGMIVKRMNEGIRAFATLTPYRADSTP